MKGYRFFLAVVLVAMLAFGIWYIASSYIEHRSSEKGLLVRSQNRQTEIYKDTENITQTRGWENADNGIY